MAQILICWEDPGSFNPLCNSLQGHHELYFANGMSEALSILRGKHIDLIICRVHMEHTNVFDFLTKVKDDPSLRDIRFVFLSSESTQLSKDLDPNLKESTLLCGADKYLILDQFYSNGTCDFDGLRMAIEEVLFQQKRATTVQRKASRRTAKAM